MNDCKLQYYSLHIYYNNLISIRTSKTHISWYDWISTHGCCRNFDWQFRSHLLAWIVTVIWYFCICVWIMLDRHLNWFPALHHEYFCSTAVAGLEDFSFTHDRTIRKASSVSRHRPLSCGKEHFSHNYGRTMSGRVSALVGRFEQNSDNSSQEVSRLKRWNVQRGSHRNSVPQIWCFLCLFQSLLLREINSVLSVWRQRIQ